MQEVQDDGSIRPDERWKHSLLGLRKPLSSSFGEQAGMLLRLRSPAIHTPGQAAHSPTFPRHTSGEAAILTVVPVRSTSIQPLGASAHIPAGEVLPSVPGLATGWRGSVGWPGAGAAAIHRNVWAR